MAAKAAIMVARRGYPHGPNLVFIGYKPTGEQLRAMCFKHANVEERVRRADVESLDISAKK